MSDPVSSSRRQWLVIGGVFVTVIALLGAAYYAFARGGYATLADHVRPGEAAAIVAELDKRGTAYELRDGGTTVLVPTAQVDATRLALVRMDAGEVGFELFDKSDMGLTGFAQKINYQRALQGELVRTIARMDGVESARVHLALPERTLFRDDRTEPGAAVSVQMRGGAVPDAARVAGIQRLVAAAVPDLPVERVVVLDAEGRVVSPAAAEPSAAVGDERYYGALARAAVSSLRPGLAHELRVVALPLPPGVAGTPGVEARDFALQVTLVTPRPLDAAEQVALAAAIRPAVGLDDARGDGLAFEAGAVAGMAAAVPVAPPAGRDVIAPTAPPPDDATRWWPWAAVAMVGILLIVLRRRSAARLSDAEQEAFAETLRRRVAQGDGGDHVAG
ncbi:flagellar basal-body MS-ring/collar protein FliF [Sphingomonas sp. CFBP 13720]|uniref:flagellar basal-body MS-ring/collar protein FliF n=1 Tax=Sphingomonas sp. CFBP 13720 TaxID=2775302 RepID=UPI0017841834|nr:flagellar basal-body MS-ring/collar protein FliF [Sphingomonas sp. CFBP 13720]MBD8679347.1 flagellar M-ring protein FliF [Sphingomonas sp. CFBP 13720]